MKFVNFTILSVFIILLSSCNTSNSDSFEENELLSDGTHCAEVTYSNPNTGTSNTYTLTVEVLNGELDQINWPNGGWLDEDHFSSVTFDDNGYCSFSSDRGYEYEVQLIEGTCSDDGAVMEEEIIQDEQAMICPRCYGQKDYDYDDYCTSCQWDIEDEEQDKKDHTCPRCGERKFSQFDDYCSDCENELEEEDEY